MPTFAEYLASLGRLTAHADPTAASPRAVGIKAAAQSLAALDEITTGTLTAWAGEHPAWVYALGLAVGLSQEKLKNTLKHHLGTSGWITLARERPADLVTMLEEQFDLVRLIEVQRNRRYDFGDILIARAGTRQTATAAGASGRKVEDEIEAIATELGLACQTRTRFTGRNGRTAPCDLVIPSAASARIRAHRHSLPSSARSTMPPPTRGSNTVSAIGAPSRLCSGGLKSPNWPVAQPRRPSVTECPVASEPVASEQAHQPT
jgi:hypothetical protein